MSGKSLTGSHFDLKPLMLSPGAPSFSIKDGDIPCTPEEEPAYSYVWNFCGEVRNGVTKSRDVHAPNLLLLIGTI